MLPLSTRPITLAIARYPVQPNSVYELKYDGFRALARIERGTVSLVSKSGFVYKRFQDLCEQMASAIRAEEAILDGEIVCVDAQGRPRFYSLMFHRGMPCFFAFDILWLDGKDLREQPLLIRKRILRKVIPKGHSNLLYVDHIEDGEGLYRVVCEQDLEGIVVKPKESKYADKRWLKVKNPNYTQAKERYRLFGRK